MSFFYLYPEQGNIHLSMLRDCVYKRAEHLMRVLNDEEFIFSEHLIEDSPLDNAGHFMLKLSAILSRNEALERLYKFGEMKYFKYRIANAPAIMIRVMCKKVIRDLNRRKVSIFQNYLCPLRDLCFKLQKRQIAEHVCSAEHRVDCEEYFIDTHFVYCLQLVKRRLVELKNGVAYIQCGRWKDFFTDLFCMHLSANNDSKCYHNNFRNDSRIMGIVEDMVQFLSMRNRINEPNSLLTTFNIDTESKHFPLCMKNLHIHLRKHHRLSHNERFLYTVFLKDIGMTLDDAIVFWKTEYSKHRNHVACPHSWQENEKKFIYSIRHSYGLEGRRKEYKAQKCFQIQSHGSLKEGGCPFKNFDDTHLLQLLDADIRDNNVIKNEIYTQKQLGRCNNACQTYMQALASSNKKERITYPSDYNRNSPVCFFKQLKCMIDF